MGSTANFGLPYPEASDSPQVHLDIKALAEGAETAIGGMARYAYPSDNGLPSGSSESTAVVLGTAPTASDIAAGKIYVTGGHNVSTTDGSGYIAFKIHASSRALLWANAINADPAARRVYELAYAQSSATRVWFRVFDTSGAVLASTSCRVAWSAAFLL